MKYLIAIMLVCVLGAGCAITPPSATSCLTNGTGQEFIVIKSGTSKGGGATGTVIAYELDGKIIPLGAFSGRSTIEQFISSSGSIVSSAGNIVGAKIISSGLRKSGSTTTVGQEQSQGQGQGQAMLQIQ